jgi:hypothetical protein
MEPETGVAHAQLDRGVLVGADSDTFATTPYVTLDDALRTYPELRQWFAKIGFASSR